MPRQAFQVAIFIFCLWFIIHGICRCETTSCFLCSSIDFIVVWFHSFHYNLDCDLFHLHHCSTSCQRIHNLYTLMYLVRLKSALVLNIKDRARTGKITEKVIAQEMILDSQFLHQQIKKWDWIYQNKDNKRKVLIVCTKEKFKASWLYRIFFGNK